MPDYWSKSVENTGHLDQFYRIILSRLILWSLQKNSLNSLWPSGVTRSISARELEYPLVKLSPLQEFHFEFHRQTQSPLLRPLLVSDWSKQLLARIFVLFCFVLFCFVFSFWPLVSCFFMQPERVTITKKLFSCQTWWVHWRLVVSETLQTWFHKRLELSFGQSVNFSWNLYYQKIFVFTRILASGSSRPW